MARLDAKTRAASMSRSNIFGDFQGLKESQFEPKQLRENHHAPQTTRDTDSAATKVSRVSQKTHGRIKPPKAPTTIPGVSIT